MVITLLNSEDLTNKYKQLMKETRPHKSTSLPSTKVSDSQKHEKHSLLDEITIIEALKQDTFEATGEFNTRRNKALEELQHKVKFFALNASEEYSTGVAKMKEYHADDEKMQLILTWSNDLKSIFLEIKDLQTVLLDISRKDAKELFSDENAHFFHIDIGYINNKLRVTRMSLYDKYEFYKLPPMKKKVNNANITEVTKKTMTKKQSTSYEVNRSFFQMHGSYNGKATFELIAQLDPESCIVNVNVKKLSNLDFGSNCKFITNQQNEKLVCLKNMNRCIKHKDLRTIVLQSLNEGNWHVSNVRSDDTLSVRDGPGVKYRKVSTLPYNANHLTVLFVQMNGKSNWYKIKYNQIVGWVNSRFLNHGD